MTKFPKQNNLIQEKIKMLLAGLHVGQSILGKTALTMAQGYRLLQVPLYVLLGLSVADMPSFSAEYVHSSPE